MIRLLALLAAAALAAPAAAQVPRITGDADDPAVRVVRAVLERGNYVWIDRDTILGDDFRAPGDLVVYDAEVRLEGTVLGSVAVIGGDFWIRPGARVGGAIGAVQGGVYPAGLAIVARDSIFLQDPRTRVTIRTVPAGADSLPDVDITADTAADGRYTAEVDIRPPPRPNLFAPTSGPTPTYDRVNGVTLQVGASVRLTPERGGARLTPWLAYRFEQPDHWAGGVGWNIPLRVQGLRLRGELSRATRTNDGWIYGDLANSVRALGFGRDYRNYHDADVARVTVERPIGTALVAGETWLGPRVGVQVSRDRSLTAQEPWSLFNRGGLARENPPVVEGTIVSLLAGTELHWRAPTTTFVGSVDVEHGLAGAGDAEFTQVVAAGLYRTRALRTHQLRFYARAMAPLGGGDAPPQRFGILGGSGTLPTEPIGAFRGDHLVFVESAYLIPIRRLIFPVVGSPAIEMTHAVGAAWVGGDEPVWVQNAGAGIVFALLTAHVVVDPARPDDPQITFGVSIPQR